MAQGETETGRKPVGCATAQLKLTAADGKRFRSDVLDADRIAALIKAFPNNKASGF